MQQEGWLKIGGGLITILCSLAVLGWGMLQQHKMQEAQTWPTTQGEITASFVTDVTSSDDSGTSYEPRVRYRYVVAGIIYEGTRIGFFGHTTYGSRRRAQRALASYPEGAKVTVYYNPQHPEEAVLEIHSSDSWLVFGTGAALALFGVWLLVQGGKAALAQRV
jgi:hypothetical protein